MLVHLLARVFHRSIMPTNPPNSPLDVRNECVTKLIGHFGETDMNDCSVGGEVGPDI